MALEMLVGLNVVDDEVYQSYRDEMTPILKSYGGGFGYDFRVSEVLKSKTDAPINRVFTIYFSNEDSMNSFFSNDEYLKMGVFAQPLQRVYSRNHPTRSYPNAPKC